MKIVLNLTEKKTSIFLILWMDLVGNSSCLVFTMCETIFALWKNNEVRRRLHIYTFLQLCETKISTSAEVPSYLAFFTSLIKYFTKCYENVVEKKLDNHVIFLVIIRDDAKYFLVFIKQLHSNFYQEFNLHLIEKSIIFVYQINLYCIMKCSNIHCLQPLLIKMANASFL